jgi:hypothetical protein
MARHNNTCWVALDTLRQHEALQDGCLLIPGAQVLLARVERIRKVLFGFLGFEVDTGAMVSLIQPGM